MLSFLLLHVLDQREIRRVTGTAFPLHFFVPRAGAIEQISDGDQGKKKDDVRPR
jgi:hypothetical protein